MLQISGLTYRIGARILFDHAGVQVPTGWRVGIVGRNGAGKTTLLRLIDGTLQPESGAIALPRGARIGTVAQEAPSGPQSLLDAVIAADAERTALLAEAETAVDPVRVADIQARLSEISANSAEARAAALLAGLGFDAAAQKRPLSDFSGGWRMRVALAGALFAEPDLLLLDEPTNHLDLEATLWLTRFLKAWPRSLILVSHDRDLLNEVPQAILHVENGGLTLYRGGYDSFVRQRAEALAQQDAARAQQAADRRRIQAFVDRFRYKATKARQAQSRLKLLERMEPIAAPISEERVSFGFPEPKPLSPPLLTLDGAAVGYGSGPPVLRGLDLQIEPDDRIGLLGANGNGKSTLVKLLAGRLQPTTGACARNPKLRVGYFAQHQLDELNPAQSAYQHLAALMPKVEEAKVRAQLGRFAFSQERADIPVANLSGGEKARLTLALITRDAPQLLLLDEPTNHLDIDAREALVAAINEYDGAVVLISHDRHLLELTADELWLVGGGTVRRYDGDLDSYRADLGGGGAARSGGNGATAVDSRKEARRQAADDRQRLAPLRKAAREAEALAHRLLAEKTRIEADLADPALYGGPPERVTELNRKRAELERRIAEAEHRWLEAEGEIEAAS